MVAPDAGRFLSALPHRLTPPATGGALSAVTARPRLKIHLITDAPTPVVVPSPQGSALMVAVRSINNTAHDGSTPVDCTVVPRFASAAVVNPTPVVDPSMDSSACIRQAAAPASSCARAPPRVQVVLTNTGATSCRGPSSRGTAAPVPRVAAPRLQLAGQSADPRVSPPQRGSLGGSAVAPSRLLGRFSLGPVAPASAVTFASHACLPSCIAQLRPPPLLHAVFAV